MKKDDEGMKSEYGSYSHTYYRVWLQTILRKRDGGYWRYSLPNEDMEKLREQAEAVRLAPKYAKEIVLMDKIGG